jgi:hypothetical protein
MRKNDHLLAHLQDSYHVVKDNIIHYVITSLCVTHLLNTVEGTLQRGRPETAVKRKSALAVSSDEFGNVFIVGQSSREPNDSDRFLHLHASGKSTGHKALKHETTLVVQKMNFINDQNVYQSHHAISLTSNYIPFFRGRNDDMSL